MHHHWGSNYVMVSLWVFLPRNAQSNQNKFTLFLQYLKAKVRDEVDFSSADKLQRLVQIDTVILSVSGILKLLKVTSLQYLYNISKEKSGMESIFLRAIKVSINWHYDGGW